mgnify:CR=1 FL=1
MNTEPHSEAGVHSRLHRLTRESYRGMAMVHWSMTMEERAAGWLNALFHAQFRELLVHACMRYEFLCPVYCLMPDHLHFVGVGFAASSDQLLAVRFCRKYLNLLLHPVRLQAQAYDHVMRPEERERGAFQRIACYVLQNPVRGGLAKAAEEYVFSGAVVPGYPRMGVHVPSYWEDFWRIHADLAGRHSA